MTTRHSPLAHAAYIDLISTLRDRTISDLRGTPGRVTRGAKHYWYDSYRIGTTVRKAYIGEDSPEIRARIARHDALKADRAAQQKSAARLVRILRAEGFLSLDAGTGGLLAAFARSGVFRLGGTLIGTHAFRLYEGELGHRISLDDSAMTRDIDLASFEQLSLALGDIVEPGLEAVFRDFAFAPAPSLEPGQTWRWRQSKGDTLVEFLTPSFEPEEGLAPLPALGVSARALHHLNYLIADPIPAAVLYRSGVLVQIPRPERFAIHKLIVADRRRGSDRLKAEKDRRQAAFLIDILSEDRPEDLAEAYADARARGPRWRQRLAATLARLPQTAARLAALDVPEIPPPT